jgi:AraC family transcriptional regulator of adaptative response/methylated-DNA-[protein]-cysteine methyltransferase
MNFKHAFVQTPCGKALLGLNNEKISTFLFLTFEKEKILQYFHKKFPNSVDVRSAELQNVVNDIFHNKKKYFNKIELHGTNFQKSVWLELMKLDEVVSYQQIAKNIGTNGVRAVASAIANNPIHYIIPCHLVIRSDGSLGKFAGGSELKQKLILEFTS